MAQTLSLNEVATDLGVAPLLVVRYTHRKYNPIPCANVGGELRFDIGQFSAWKKANWDLAGTRFAPPLTSDEKMFPDEFDTEGNLR
jgi:hypothetical protein